MPWVAVAWPRGLGEAAPLNRSFPAVLGSAGGGRFAPDPELSGKQPVWLRAWVRGDACWDGKLEAGGHLLSPLRAPGSGRVLRVEQEAGPGRRPCGARTSPVIPHNEPAFQAECKSGSRGEAIRQTPGDPGATAAGRRGREAAFPLSCEGWVCVSSGAGRVGRGSITDGGKGWQGAASHSWTCTGGTQGWERGSRTGAGHQDADRRARPQLLGSFLKDDCVALSLSLPPSCCLGHRCDGWSSKCHSGIRG